MGCRSPWASCSPRGGLGLVQRRLHALSFLSLLGLKPGIDHYAEVSLGMAATAMWQAILTVTQWRTHGGTRWHWAPWCTGSFLKERSRAEEICPRSPRTRTPTPPLPPPPPLPNLYAHTPPPLTTIVIGWPTNQRDGTRIKVTLSLMRVFSRKSRAMVFSMMLLKSKGSGCIYNLIVNCFAFTGLRCAMFVLRYLGRDPRRASASEALYTAPSFFLLRLGAEESRGHRRLAAPTLNPFDEAAGLFTL